MSEWHDGTPNSGGNGCGCLGILTIVAVIVLTIAGILFS